MLRTVDSWARSFPHVAELTGLGPSSSVWLPGPLTTTMNLFAATLARWCGAGVVAQPGEATHAHLTPLQLERLLAGGGRLDGLHLTVAGERLGAGTRDRARAAGATVAHYYGAAELSFVGWGTCAEDLRPFPGVEVEVRSDEVWVRSAYLCDGYAGEPGVLRRDERGFASVGDRGTVTGGRLRVWGRGADAVTTGGATVLVADVERTLAPVLSGTIAVVGSPHPVLGQVVTAVLTCASDVKVAQAAARGLLERELRPRRWFEVAELPMTSAGKVDRPRLVELLAEGSLRALTPFPSVVATTGARGPAR